jgi:hypothetical protein
LIEFLFCFSMLDFLLELQLLPIKMVK